MKCLKCKKTFGFSMKTFVKGFIQKGNHPFCCQECNRIEKWKRKRPLGLSHINVTASHLDIPHYHCSIHSWLNKTMREESKLYKITMRTDATEYLFPEKYESDYLYGKNDLWREGVEGKFHEAGNQYLRMAIDSIKCIDVIDINDDYIEPDVMEPIYGYKGLTVEKGIIGDGKYTYCIGEPYVEEKRGNPFKVDYQDCYSHFCLNMEEPLLIWGRDYIHSYVIEAEKGLNYKTTLFKVKAEGHCRQNTEYGWVSNHLTLIEEISKQKIIDYYESNPELLKKLNNYWRNQGITDNVWDKYKKL